MSLEHILLGMLREPASGFDLKAEFEAGCRHFWSAELSQIYPTLQRLEERGLLKSHREPSPRGPERRVFRRTAKGTKELHDWLRSGPVLGNERFAYIGQLLFHEELNDEAATRRFLEGLREKLLAFQRLLEGAEEELRAANPNFPHGLSSRDFHGLLSLRLGVRSLRAKVEVCEEGLGLLRAREPKETANDG
jgi:DNA-binding PadR family transcriptional regulator